MSKTAPPTRTDRDVLDALEVRLAALEARVPETLPVPMLGDWFENRRRIVLGFFNLALPAAVWYSHKAHPASLPLWVGLWIPALVMLVSLFLVAVVMPGQTYRRIATSPTALAVFWAMVVLSSLAGVAGGAAALVMLHG